MNKPKYWIEATVQCSTESSDAVGNILFELGCAGIEEKDGAITGYFVQTLEPEALGLSLESCFQNLKNLGFWVGKTDLRQIPNEDWGSQWLVYFKPIQITPTLVVKPPWEKWKGRKGSIVIDITPRMAFGTGSHETTRLCLGLLERYVRHGSAVLDLGTGSGILAIAAVKMGARSVFAVDVDEDALCNAKENVLQNRVEGEVEINSGSLELAGSRRFDLILANIDRKSLFNLIPKMKFHVHEKSRLIFSGILTEERAIMEEWLQSGGFQSIETRMDGEWIALAAVPA